MCKRALVAGDASGPLRLTIERKMCSNITTCQHFCMCSSMNSLSPDMYAEIYLGMCARVSASVRALTHRAVCLLTCSLATGAGPLRPLRSQPLICEVDFAQRMGELRAFLVGGVAERSSAPPPPPARRPGTSSARERRRPRRSPSRSRSSAARDLWGPRRLRELLLHGSPRRPRRGARWDPPPALRAPRRASLHAPQRGESPRGVCPGRRSTVCEESRRAVGFWRSTYRRGAGGRAMPRCSALGWAPRIGRKCAHSGG